MGQENILSHFFMYSKEMKRGEADFSASPLKFPVKLLVEVPLQQALKSLAMAGLVARHLIECSTAFRIRKRTVSQGFFQILL